MENILQKIGKFLGEKFALIDKDFAKKTELEKETERAKKSEEELSDTKVAKEEGKQLMPSPSTTPAENKFLSEDGTWKEIDMTSVNESISGLEDADSELERKLNEEITRAKGVEEKKVDKLEGKGLSANDYTSEEKNKLKNIGTYVNDIYPSYGNEERLKLVSSAINPESGATTDKSVIIPEANSQKNGLLSSLHYSTLEGLMNNGLYLDATGTPSNTWQLSKTPEGTPGPLIKNSGGILELRTGADNAYTDLTLNNIVIKGNVTQEGSSFITNAETVETADNTIMLNKGETGAGVTKGKAGLEIDRGTLPAYKILFDESDDRFKAGQGEDLWPIMLREKVSDLTNGMLLSWNSNTKRAETTNNIPRGQYLNFISGGTNDDVIIGNTLFKSVLIAWKNKTTGEITDKVMLTPSPDDGLFLSTTKEIFNFDKPVKATTFYNSSGQEVAYKNETLFILQQGKNITLNLDAKTLSVTDIVYNELLEIVNTHKKVQLIAKDSFNPDVQFACMSTCTSYSSTEGITIQFPVFGVMESIIEDASAPVGIDASAITLRISNTSENGIHNGQLRTSIDIIQLTSLGLGLRFDDPKVGGHGGGIYMEDDTLMVECHKICLLTDNLYQYAGNIDTNKIWSEYNHGTGSGLDADLLDGRQGNEYALASTVVNKSTLLTPVVETEDLAVPSEIGSTGVFKVLNTTTVGGDGFIWANRWGENFASQLYIDTDTTHYIALRQRSSTGTWNRWERLALDSEIPTNYVTTDTAQTISGNKTFTAAVTSSAGFYDTSDIRLKSNIKEIELNSEKIRLCEFDKNGKHSYGVIAQEIEKLYPTTVQEGKDGYKTVNYNEVLTIKCAELEKRIDMLEKKLANQ